MEAHGAVDSSHLHSEELFEASLNAHAAHTHSFDTGAMAAVSFEAEPSVRTKRAFRNITRSLTPTMTASAAERPANPRRITLKTEGALARAAQPEIAPQEWRNAVSDSVAAHRARRKKTTAAAASLDLFTAQAESTDILNINAPELAAAAAEAVADAAAVEAPLQMQASPVVKTPIEAQTHALAVPVVETMIEEQPAVQAQAAVQTSVPTVEGHEPEDITALLLEIREAETRAQMESELAGDEGPVAEIAAPRVGPPVKVQEVLPKMEAEAPAAVNVEEPAVMNVEEPAKPENNLIEFPKLPLEGPAAALAATELADATLDAMLEEELAEPVLTTPRILEAHAPVAPPKPSPLDTIRLEAAELDFTQAPDWVREYDDLDPAHLDLPPQAAPFVQRALSGAVDALWVLTATAMFAVIVTSITEFLPTGRAGFFAALTLPVFLWTAYQYLFLVFAGRTPGMAMAQLELTGFDGVFPARRVRAQRAVAVLVSCISVGLGFLWAAVDEDHLGWHDRITKTYLRES